MMIKAGADAGALAGGGSLLVSVASFTVSAIALHYSRKAQLLLEQDKSRKLDISLKEGDWVRTKDNLLLIHVLVYNPSTRVNTIKGYRITTLLADGKEHLCRVEEMHTFGGATFNPLPLEIAPGGGTEVKIGTSDINFTLLPDPFSCEISIIDVYGRSSSFPMEIPHPERSLRLMYPTSTP
jgi:hypothetical protein